MGFEKRKKVTPRYHNCYGVDGSGERYGTEAENVSKNNERPETFSSPGRPGSPPPELLTEQIKRVADFCLGHLRAIPTQKVP